MFYFCLFVCIDLYENDLVRGVWDEIFFIRLQDPLNFFFFFQRHFCVYAHVADIPSHDAQVCSVVHTCTRATYYKSRFFFPYDYIIVWKKKIKKFKKRLCRVPVKPEDFIYF